MCGSVYDAKVTDYKAAWRERVRSWAVSLLGGKCSHCEWDGSGLQFDHIDAATKDFEISVGIRNGYGRGRLEQELKKCQLLCLPCHQEKSRLAGETGGGWNRIDDPRHGTAVMYGKMKCRCMICVQWKRDYRAKLVDSLGVAHVAVAQLA
jgi:hypothetical protein